MQFSLISQEGQPCDLAHVRVVQGGRTIEVEVPEGANIRTLKRAIEDKEGIAQEGMTILTTAKQVWPVPLAAAPCVCAGC